MTLEWLRRQDAKWDEVLRTYLFTDAPITEIEAIVEGASSGERATPSIGDHRGAPEP